MGFLIKLGIWLAFGAVNTKDPRLDGVYFENRIGNPVPTSLLFQDDSGRRSLSSFLHRGPLLLALVYFRCPNLCTFEVQGLAKALSDLPPDNAEASVLFVSIDPSDDAKSSQPKRELFRSRLARKEFASRTHFLTGDARSIASLAGAVGFHYTYDPKTKQYLHPNGLVLLTPEGKVSRYLYGTEYSPRDLRLGLVEASLGKLGTFQDKFLLLCYHYDEAQGVYGVRILAFVRLFAAATLLGLAVPIVLSLRRERAA